VSLVEERLGRGIRGHHSARAKTDDWLTPPEILNALGPFDLDPCASRNQPWRTATVQFTEDDNGLLQAWKGRVWLNPPYGKEAAEWLERMALHGNGIALVFARTETKMFFTSVWPKASALLFLRGRLNFHRPGGDRSTKNAGGPTVLIAYGLSNAHRLEACGIPGAFVRLHPLMEAA